MIGKEKLFEIFDKVVRAGKADEIEILFIGSTNGLTR